MRFVCLALALFAAVPVRSETVSLSEIDTLIRGVMNELRVPGAAVGLIQ